MGEVGERTLQVCIGEMVEAAVHESPELIRSLEIGTSIGCLICDRSVPCD
jgi:hypothetical protein